MNKERLFIVTEIVSSLLSECTNSNIYEQECKMRMCCQACPAAAIGPTYRGYATKCYTVE